MKYWPTDSLTAAATLFIITTVHLQARLGETPIQCADRYGSPKRDSLTQANEKMSPMLPGTIQHTYEYKGWRIRAAFLELDGPAIRVEYQKIPPSGINPSLEDYEFEAVLKGETPDGMKWRSTTYYNPNSPNTGLSKVIEGAAASALRSQTWQRSDGAIAQLQPGGFVIRLESPAAREYEKQLKIKKEQKARGSVPQF